MVMCKYDTQPRERFVTKANQHYYENVPHLPFIFEHSCGFYLFFMLYMCVCVFVFYPFYLLLLFLLDVSGESLQGPFEKCMLNPYTEKDVP